MSATYGLAYKRTALEYLESSVPPKIRRQIKRRVEILAENPTPPTSKKLHDMFDGEESIYRARQGKYRILYVIRGIIILVVAIDDRKDVYRR